MQVVSGEVGRQHSASSGAKDTEVPQPCGGTQACVSFPVNVEDDSDNDLSPSDCGYEPAAFL